MADADIAISESDFYRNNAVKFGGAVRLFEIMQDTETTVTNNKFVRNVAGVEGGAVYTSSLTGDLTTERNLLFRNRPDNIVSE